MDKPQPKPIAEIDWQPVIAKAQEYFDEVEKEGEDPNNYMDYDQDLWEVVMEAVYDKAALAWLDEQDL